MKFPRNRVMGRQKSSKGEIPPEFPLSDSILLIYLGFVERLPGYRPHACAKYIRGVRVGARYNASRTARETTGGDCHSPTSRRGINGHDARAVEIATAVAMPREFT